VYGRSTLNRAGILLRSSIYDSGFVCNKIGFTMYPFNDCVIERESRIAQIIFYESHSNTMYNGQYQEQL
jgi:deoxycytidine triphosphate deaminase